MEFGVWGLGFGVWSLGFGVWRLGLIESSVEIEGWRSPPMEPAPPGSARCGGGGGLSAEVLVSSNPRHALADVSTRSSHTASLSIGFAKDNSLTDSDDFLII